MNSIDIANLLERLLSIEEIEKDNLIKNLLLCNWETSENELIDQELSH